MPGCLTVVRGTLSHGQCRKWQRDLGLQVQALRSLHPEKHSGKGQGWVWSLPEGGAFGPRDFQKVVTILQLEVNEDQGDGVSQLGQDSPGAVGVVVVLRGEVGAGDDAALAPQGPAAGVVRCGWETRGSLDLVLFAGPGIQCALTHEKERGS